MITLMVSDWCKSGGSVPTRIVLRMEATNVKDKATGIFATHCESVHEDGEVAHYHGRYFEDAESGVNDFLKRKREFEKDAKLWEFWRVLEWVRDQEKKEENGSVD